MKVKNILLVLTMAALLVGCAPAAVGGAYATNTLSVTGSAQVYMTPDVAYVSIGVHAEDSEVSSAVSRSNQVVSRIMDVLTGAGVAREDIQTNNFSIYSVDQYDFEGNRDGVLYYVDNTVYVTVRDLDRMGELLDDAIEAGANSIWGIQFDVSDRSEAQSEARENAMAKAEEQAQQLAELAGVTLGDIVSVSSSSPAAGYYYQGYGVGGGGGGAADTASTSIVPGQITVSVDVYLVYEIQ